MQTTHGLHHHRTMIKKPLPNGDREPMPGALPRRLVTSPSTRRRTTITSPSKPRSEMYSPEFVRPKVRSAGLCPALDSVVAQATAGEEAFFGQIQLKGGKIGGETGSKHPAESRVDPGRTRLTCRRSILTTRSIRNAIARHYEQIAADRRARLGRSSRRLKGVRVCGTRRSCLLLHRPRLRRSRAAKQFLYEEGDEGAADRAWSGFGEARRSARAIS